MRICAICLLTLSAACSGETGSQDVAAPADGAKAVESPLLTYDASQQDAFMQALGGGVLTLEGGCVYLANGASRVLLILPEPPAQWNAERGTIQFGERELRFGDEVAFGGGEGGSIAPGPVADAARRKSCDTSRIWWASPETITPRALPQAMPPPAPDTL